MSRSPHSATWAKAPSSLNQPWAKASAVSSVSPASVLGRRRRRTRSASIVVDGSVVVVGGTVVDAGAPATVVATGPPGNVAGTLVGVGTTSTGSCSGGSCGAADASRSRSENSTSRWRAVHRGWQVVSVSVATVGSVVATTSDADGATISLPVSRYTKRPVTVVTMISSPTATRSRSANGSP